MLVCMGDRTWGLVRTTQGSESNRKLRMIFPNPCLDFLYTIKCRIHQETTLPPLDSLKKKWTVETVVVSFVSLRQFAYYCLLPIFCLNIKRKFCYDIIVVCSICLFSQCDHLSPLRAAFYFWVVMKDNKYVFKTLNNYQFYLGGIEP